uniref:NADH dehydrogenase subunit 6 n=1 Tax=Trapezia rufopunctata TaxID=399052 RepID=UPI0028D65129|nr:NADH dehydrogenase subunit 6 [Trapezia rufopunctata]WMQ53230.1 NADH dehydrogenase subunit 6 [Trapezia rufopunctata]
MMLMIPLIFLLSISFTQLKHPLALGLNLLIQTISISIISGTSTYSFWFSYILFMIFLGGMLVLFIYVASLASNEPFFFSMKSLSIYCACFFMSELFLYFTDLVLLPHISSLPTSSISSNLSTPFFISWIYNNNFMSFTLFIILYLLLTLIVVVKITNFTKSPLRLLN